MSRRSLFSLCLAMPVVAAFSVSPMFACAQDPAAVSNQDLAYSLGASLGERLREEVPGLDVQALVNGLQQAYKKEPLALSQERIEQILAQHDAQTNMASASEEALAAEQAYLAKERSKPGVRALADGVLVTEISAGSGPKTTASGGVQVVYKGMLPDGSVFDQNQQPQWFKLDSVIEGWRIALLDMPKGAKWRVVVPSAQGYGAEGAGDLIAPFTPLTFEIELLDVAN